MTRVFLDVDGVLADFTMGVHNKLGIPLSYGNWPYKYGPEGWHWHNELGMTFNQMSDVCDFDFWLNVPWTVDGKAILDAVVTLVSLDQVTLLTTPMPHVMSASGKIAWIERNIPDFKWRTLICLDKKHTLSQVPNSILVDDCQDNVNRWRIEGGRAVLVPRPWNNLCEYADAAMPIFRSILESEIFQMSKNSETA